MAKTPPKSISIAVVTSDYKAHAGKIMESINQLCAEKAYDTRNVEIISVHPYKLNMLDPIPMKRVVHVLLAPDVEGLAQKDVENILAMVSDSADLVFMSNTNPHRAPGFEIQ